MWMGLHRHLQPFCAIHCEFITKLVGGKGFSYQVNMFLFTRLMPCLVALLLGLGACAGTGANLPPIPPPAAGPYRLGAGDLVRIMVYGARELTGSFAVGDDGTVSLPLAGTVPATGHDSGALALAIAARLESRGMM